MVVLEVMVVLEEVCPVLAAHTQRGSTAWWCHQRYLRLVVAATRSLCVGGEGLGEVGCCMWLCFIWDPPCPSMWGCQWLCPLHLGEPSSCV